MSISQKMLYENQRAALQLVAMAATAALKGNFNEAAYYAFRADNLPGIDGKVFAAFLSEYALNL